MSESEKPKIIIDEDWKTQVEREKEEAAAREAAETVAPTAEESASAEPEADPSGAYLPPATFEVLVSSIATQVLAALGQLPDPQAGEQEVHLDYAKLQIDLLDMLEAKTQGNLNEAERQMLEEALSQLKMLYIAVKGA